MKSETHLTRRQIIALTGQLGLLAMIGGCGGGGGAQTASGPSVPMKTYTGAVTLPAGVNPNNVLVVAGLNTAKLVNGKFTVSAPADAPTPITVCDMSAKSLVLLGMLDPASHAPVTLNAASSAAGLLYFALGGSNMTRDGIAPLYSLISGAGATATLGATIGSRLTANPYALGAGDSQITSGLATAVGALKAQVSVEGVAGIPTPAVATLDLIQPTGVVDGATFLQASSGTGFQVQNSKRRLGFVYTYLTGHVDKNGIQTAVSPPQQIGELLEVPSCHSLFNLGQAWGPATSANVELELDGADSKTLYTMVFLTQVYGGANPTFFTEPMWENEVPKWEKTLSELGSATFVGFLGNILFSAIGFGGLTFTFSELSAAVTSMVAIPSVATLITQASTSTPLLGDLALQALTEFVEGDISKQLLLDMSILVRVASAQAAALLAAAEESAAALAALVFVIEGLIVAGAIILAADVGAISVDTSTGNRGDLWTATVVPQVLKLTPSNPIVSPGSSVDFTVSPPAGVTGAVEYHWSQKGSDTFFDNLAGTSGTTLVSTNPTIELETLSTDTTNNVITVTGYVVSGSKQTEIGSAQTKVIINQSVTLNTGAVSQTPPVDVFWSNEPVYTVYAYAFFTPVSGKTAIVSYTPPNGTSGPEATLSPEEFAGGAGTFSPSTNFYSYSSASAMPQPYGAGSLIIGIQTSHCYNLGGGKVAAILYIGVATADGLDDQITLAKAVVASINIVFQ